MYTESAVTVLDISGSYWEAFRATAGRPGEESLLGGPGRALFRESVLIRHQEAF